MLSRRLALEGGMLGPIAICCLRCVRIGADERVLLDVLGLAQKGRPFEALLMLRHLLHPESARAGRFLPGPEMLVPAAPWLPAGH